jgi:hypothetical protein
MYRDSLGVAQLADRLYRYTRLSDLVPTVRHHYASRPYPATRKQIRFLSLLFASLHSLALTDVWLHAGVTGNPNRSQLQEA